MGAFMLWSPLWGDWNVNSYIGKQESHLLAGSCKVYGDIRQKFGDLDDEENLVEFFKHSVPKWDINGRR